LGLFLCVLEGIPELFQKYYIIEMGLKVV